MGEGALGKRSFPVGHVHSVGQGDPGRNQAHAVGKGLGGHRAPRRGSGLGSAGQPYLAGGAGMGRGEAGKAGGTQSTSCSLH